MLLQHLLNGITIGCAYALIALGYTLVYGVLRLINFAHGEIYMIGAYLTYIFITILSKAGGGLPAPLLVAAGVAVAALFSVLFGYYLERICYRPLLASKRLSPLISALGASIFLQNFVMVTMGARNKTFPRILDETPLAVAGVRVTPMQIIIIATSFILMAGLYFFINRTRFGTAIRAASADPFMASLLGVNVSTVVSLTFMIGSFLAACAGATIGMHYGVIDYSIGYLAGMKAFTAAVLGGIGNITGAMAGGLILGVIEALGAGYLTAQYKDVYAFLILIGVLIVKPSGIFGAHVHERA